MQTFTKKFKGKVIKALVVQEKSSFFEGTAYCPWCSEIKRITNKSSDKRAADALFSLVTAHYNIAHKNN